MRKGGGIGLGSLPMVLSFVAAAVADQFHPQGGHFFISRPSNRANHRQQEGSELHRNHAPTFVPKYQEAFDSVSWITPTPAKHAIDKDPPSAMANHRFPSGSGEGGVPGMWDPDAEYVGRVSYEFQKPLNAYETQWPNHKYQSEAVKLASTPSPPLLLSPTPAQQPPSPPLPPLPSLPSLPRPPRGWELVSFRVADGNRTIHVRRYVRRPGRHSAWPGLGAGTGAGAADKRPPAPVYLLPPRNTTVLEGAGDGDDLQAADTLSLPAWARPVAPNAGPADLSQVAKNKLAKFLSLFTVIRFANSPCPTAEGLPGTCYHRLECQSMGGVASGTCARGYGVCCLFQASCGGRTAQNCTYFVNADWPAAAVAGPAGASAGACMLTVDKQPGVTQLRLDFLTFELARPMDGLCIDEQFVVSGQNVNSIVPVLCGDNTGQHVYVDVDAVNGPVQLTALGGGRYRVKVTQQRPGDARAAPRNCLQYLQGVSGSLRSFNYNGGSYTNDLNYAICIRKEPGYCSITYSVRAENGSVSDFQLINVDSDGQALVPPGQAGAEAFNCPDDYIAIGGLRLCGDRLNDASLQVDFTQNAPVTDTTAGPFVVQVRTNGDTVGRGFQLQYMQNLCGT